MATKARVAPVVGSGGDSEPEAEAELPRPPYAPFTYTQVIHSGHFMVSSPHSDASPGGLRGGGRPSYDFDTVNRTWCQTYRYGPLSSGSLSIDPTLTRLFECMSLAYSGKIVSPKWKTFKGLRLLWRDKIRLNNAIWRAWFIQYVEKRKNPVCGFVTPLEGSEADAHRKPEAIILEGSYWKRRIEVVIKEYHKWRIYYKKRLQKKKDGIISMLQEGQICQAKLEKWSSQMYPEPEATPEDAHMFDLDYLLSDISDTLFTMTQKPCPWASERHNAYTTNADMIQPGLTPLQPNLDDFMDIPDIFLNSGVQPCEQTAFADSGYFESSSSIALAPDAPVHTAPQLLIDTQLSQVLAQAGLSSENLPEASSSNSQTEGARLNQDCGEYRSTALPYGPQSYADPVLSTPFAANVEPVFSAAFPFFYPVPCHKFSYHTPTTASVTPTVITHTASTTGSAQQAPSYPHLGDTYPRPPCRSLSYPTIMSVPVQTAQPPGGASHCFAVPEQVSSTEVRGKHKRKRGGARTSGPAVGLSYTTSAAPASCLAKLLSTGKPSVGFEVTRVTGKGQKSSSPSSSVSSSGQVAGASSQVQHGANWHGVLPVLRNQSSAQGHRQSSTGSAASALLSDDTAHTSAAGLLIPKTEKLSPVQLYGTDRSSLTGYPSQTSPPNLLEKSSNAESPHSGFLGYGMIESSKLTETRRITHISAEQKRRFNIKLGFDTLHNLVTTLGSQPSIKISKATTLQKTAEYISKMQQERALLHEETQRLRDEIQLLNSAINACQQQLPATGVPITRQRFDHMRQKFREYVQAQTLQNWKFWIFSIIIEPLFESYNGMVSTASVEQLCQSTLCWLDQHCSLPSLRPMVLSSLRLLSTTTSILTEPRLLPEQAAFAVTQGDPSATLAHSIQHPAQDNILNM
ncbi:carbohydrate-responsive element-binding protein-like isoform X2 [Phyllopteryx taeniolatus]|uniref:carbohydrate-responsive element-binding protein-like isoform X2 n=1 Tax=Phyllopteryx taeniolatus TaxID=161469 RepID=UPI002AD5877F|nr:carbohydrate-responsive element-binding protein-like isoform X2 [Phyllopteryx taeniolatus]